MVECGAMDLILVRKGEVGVAYKKGESRLNSIIFDSVKIDKKDPMKLVTNYSLKIDNKCNYDLIAKDHS